MMSQLDYIFFIYGLAFLLLAAVLHTLRRDAPAGLWWPGLFWFSALHGANEWLDMAALSLGEVSCQVLAQN